VDGDSSDEGNYLRPTALSASALQELSSKIGLR
jgi:hypothetical protein